MHTYGTKQIHEGCRYGCCTIDGVGKPRTSQADRRERKALKSKARAEAKLELEDYDEGSGY